MLGAAEGHNMENVQHQRCLWKLLQECVPESERPEFRSVLGDSLIDMYTELHTEMQTWEQIWLEAERSGECSRPQAPCALADPPLLKALLRAEIQMLLENLREKATRLGRDEDEVLSRYRPRVVSYALGESATEKRGSPSSQCGRMTPLSRSSSRLSSRSESEDEIQALKDKLNITHIDEVVAHLKSVLTEECEALRSEIQLLQESLELECQRQKDLVEPTITELKEERRILHNDLNVWGLVDETVCKDEPRLCPSPFHSRKIMLANLTVRDLEVGNESASSVPFRTDLPCPTPPPSSGAPDCVRPNSGKPRHRLSLKAMQPQELECEDFSVSLKNRMPKDMHQLTPNNSTCSTVGLKSSGHCHKIRLLPTHLNHGLPSGSCDVRRPLFSTHLGLEADTAGARAQAPLAPTPPTVQRTAHSSQRATRTLTLPQAKGLLSPS